MQTVRFGVALAFTIAASSVRAEDPRMPRIRAIVDSLFDRCSAATNDESIRATSPCNIFADQLLREVYNIYDLSRFTSEPRNANATYDLVTDSKAKCWQGISPDLATDLAAQGRPVIAVWKNPTGGSGHIALVIGDRNHEKSGKWGHRYAPLVVGITKCDPVDKAKKGEKCDPVPWFKCVPCGAQWAFGAEPNYLVRHVDETCPSGPNGDAYGVPEKKKDANPGTAPAGPITLPAKPGNVTFAHKTHSALNCTDCHRDEKGGDIAGLGKDLNKEKAHATCQDCHKKEAKGPQKCADCHKKGT
jgi:hypothetical protein